MYRAIKKAVISCLSAMLLIASPLFMSTVTAVEIAPIEQINPEKLQDELEGLEAGNELSQTQTSLQAASPNKSKPSIWSWLTNQSRKPAVYHFIDIIEILD